MAEAAGGALRRGDERIFSHDAALGQWRHVPDSPTFHAPGFYWHNVTAGSPEFLAGITAGPPHQRSQTPAGLGRPRAPTVSLDPGLVGLSRPISSNLGKSKAWGTYKDRG